MRGRNLLAVGAAAALALSVGGMASAATYTSQSGFGSGLTFSSCQTAVTTSGFDTGTKISNADYNHDCVGFFSVDVDTTAQTITLTGLEGGNYEEGFLEITGISELVITNLQTLSYTGLFDPNFYGEPETYGAVPTPQLSFTGSSLRIAFSAFGQSPGQFTYDAAGGQAVFQYNGVANVPEPMTWALMIAGFAGAGAALRRRAATV